MVEVERVKSWFPTLTLSLDIAARLPEGGVEWLLVTAEVRRVVAGRCDVEVCVLLPSRHTPLPQDPQDPQLRQASRWKTGGGGGGGVTKGDRDGDRDGRGDEMSLVARGVCVFLVVGVERNTSRRRSVRSDREVGRSRI